MSRDAGLVEPLPRVVESCLRTAVLQHAGSERRRRHPALLHVGTPGGREAVFGWDADDGPLDHGLRTDVVAALLRRSGPDRHPDRPAERRAPSEPGAPRPPWPVVWLTRPGELDLQDGDAAWLAAARAATGEAGLPLLLVTVNRHGWRDPRSGLARTWVRLRPRSG